MLKFASIDGTDSLQDHDNFIPMDQDPSDSQQLTLNLVKQDIRNNISPQLGDVHSLSPFTKISLKIIPKFPYKHNLPFRWYMLFGYIKVSVDLLEPWCIRVMSLYRINRRTKANMQQYIPRNCCISQRYYRERSQTFPQSDSVITGSKTLTILS